MSPLIYLNVKSSVIIPLARHICYCVYKLVVCTTLLSSLPPPPPPPPSLSLCHNIKNSCHGNCFHFHIIMQFLCICFSIHTYRWSPYTCGPCTHSHSSFMTPYPSTSHPLPLVTHNPIPTWILHPLPLVTLIPCPLGLCIHSHSSSITPYSHGSCTHSHSSFMTPYPRQPHTFSHSPFITPYQCGPTPTPTHHS